MKLHNAGGYREGSGRGHKGKYKGIYCDSTWELAYLIYCIDHGIEIQRNTEKFPYEFDNKICYYLPDFKINSNQLVEIKGWKDRKALVKENIFTNVILIDKTSISKYIKYVLDTYNVKTLEELYD